jgi:hypothetical protein
MRTQAAKRQLVERNKTHSVSDQPESFDKFEISEEAGPGGQLRLTKEQILE